MSHPDCSLARPRTAKGFTLLELMVVLAIVGVLYAVVSPRYQQFVLRSHRAEGQALLVDAAARQARYHAQNHQYVTQQADVGHLQLPRTSGSEVTSPSGMYRLDIGSGDGGYLLQAVPLGTQQADSLCASLLLDGTGNHGSTGTGAVSECWK